MLTNKFDTKDLHVTDVILEIKISKIFNGLVLSQSHYVKKILEKFSKDDNSTVKTSIDISIHLFKNRSKGINQLEYSQIIRWLMYVITYIRPDIAYLVSKLSTFTSNSNMNHWKVIKTVLKYLRCTLNYELHYTQLY
jgi:hypothetical protein